MNSVTIIGNTSKGKKVNVPLSERELRELKTNLDEFITEYDEYLDDEYKFFLKKLSAKLLYYIVGSKNDF